MKKFNKFLTLGLVGVSALTGGFMLSGCDVTNDKDNTQNEQSVDENKIVTSITIDQNTLPNYIIRNKFARTNIKMVVTYEDGTSKMINVTESMLDEASKQEIKYIGQYNLTVNYGGKTATIYANVVDERYLLKEVVETNLDKDVTVTTDDGTISQRDTDNKILYCNDNEDYISWMWLNNNICYNYESEDGIDKGLVSDFDNCAQNSHEIMIFDIINGVDEYGISWTINSIEADGPNYILTATHGVGEQYKYYFNDDFMYKVEEIDGSYTYVSNYNYSILNLEVPAEIKAMESDATINVEDRISDLKDMMSNYLKSDFEMNIFDNSSNTTWIYQMYDADNKIRFKPADSDGSSWSWVNGDYYYYAYIGTSNLIYKDNISNWDRAIIVSCFTFDEIFENCTVDISADGKYYELILPSVDGNEEVWEYKYVFNYEEIYTVDVQCDGQYMGSYTYNKTDVVLEVPDDIKALESSAQ